MPVTLNQEDKHCENCGRSFHTGRTDRRFCNDTCRNAFNRKKLQLEKLVANESIPEIFRIIKRNYEILKGFGELERGTQLWIQEKLADTGINPKFFTSIQQEGDTIWYFCFERGWKELDGMFEVKEDFDQLDIG
jgi:hypothetical protein